MRYKATVAAVAAAALLATGISFAQAPGGGMHPGGGPPEQGMRGPRGGRLEKLNLTQEQRQQLEKLMQAEREANQEVAGRMPELQQQLQEAIFLGKGDINGTAEQINDLQAQMLKARIAHQQKVAAILTAEQREQMAKMAPMGPGAGPMGRGRGGRGGH
ncbi:MAG: periplasmic heavy metal sensor [Acidobacteria bacterium]|nr:MAG: periplasmic heavy metal sensor [Acidobacteriota bacterium]